MIFFRRVLCFAFVFLAVNIGLAQEVTPTPMSFEEQAALFDYDSTADFNIVEVGVEDRDGVTVQDITFVGLADADPIPAYLVMPEGEGPFAGILWVHWLGEHNSNRTEFLEEAVSLAKEGVVSLLVDTMWAKPGWYQTRNLDEDYANGVKQVIELRRAMDLLISQPNVDPERIGFVGHDFGGMYGTVMAGLDQEAKAYVFIATTSSFFDWAFYSQEPESMEDYLLQNAPLEPMTYLSQIKDASFLFQFAEEDFYVSEASRETYFDTAAEPKKLLVYPGDDHSMSAPEIRQERDEWLRAELGLESE
jgi:dienelactone hydrolase